MRVGTERYTTIMKNKCKMTMSGKHIWREEFDGYEGIEEGNYVPLGFMGKVKTIKKCMACGMIDDRKKVK